MEKGKKALGIFGKLALALVCVSALAESAMAIPVLQLDIQGGYYDSSTQTIVSGGSVFTLYAYLKPNGSNTVTDTYFISAAITPQYGPTGGNIGSFTFAGQNVNATADMLYGTPPLEANLAFQSGDLSKHGTFPTYFKEFAFQFGTDQSDIYNTQDETGIGPQAGTGMYYKAFTVDVGSLNAPYQVHFDLYNTTLISTNPSSPNFEVTKFAPFSHDAESGPGKTTSVPEPSSLVLLAGGLAVLIGSKRFRS